MGRLLDFLDAGHNRDGLGMGIRIRIGIGIRVWWRWSVPDPNPIPNKKTRPEGGSWSGLAQSGR